MTARPPRFGLRHWEPWLALALLAGCGSKSDEADSGISVNYSDTDTDTDTDTDADADTDTDTDADADADADSDADTDTDQRLPVATSIPDVQGGTHVPGDEVIVEGIVTGTAEVGLYLQDPVGGSYSGVWVYLDRGWRTTWGDLDRGDALRVTGTFEEAGGLTQVNVDASTFGDVVALSTGGPEPLPEVVPMADLGDPSTAEPWESVLIEVRDVIATDPIGSFNEWEISDPTETWSVLIDDQIHHYGAHADGTLELGTPFDRIAGPLNFAFSRFKIAVRDEDDLELGDGAFDPEIVIHELIWFLSPGAPGDANCDGTTDFEDDEFVELVNIGQGAVDLSYGVLKSGSTVVHTFEPGSVLKPGETVVVFGGGRPLFDGTGPGAWCVALPAEVTTVTASSGSLALGNTTGVVSLELADGTELDSYAFGNEGGASESVTRAPQLSFTKPMVPHTALTAAAFSPGTLADGSVIELPEGTVTLPPPPPPNAIILNEILHDPASGNGDANCDGTVDDGDEFVEIVNVSAATVDLSLSTLSNDRGVRHTFANPTLLRPGEAVVLFSGGTPVFDGSGTAGPWCVDLPREVDLVLADLPLELDDVADTVTLTAAVGSRINRVAYGTEGVSDQSLNRNPELTFTLPMVGHTMMASQPFSPGTLADGGALQDGPQQNTSIYDVQQGRVAEDTEITVSGIVTGFVTFGFFVQDERSGPYSGIWVYSGSTGPWSVRLGDVVEVTGRYVEYFDLTEIDLPTATAPNVEVVGSASVPVPAELTLADLASPATAEPYEGVLVVVRNVEVEDNDSGYGEFTVTEQGASQHIQIVDDLIYQWSGHGTAAPGTPINSITGPVNYTFSNYKLEPRTEGDIQD